MGVKWHRFAKEAKGSGKKLTAEYTLADALFEGANVSLAEKLFSLPVNRVSVPL